MSPGRYVVICQWETKSDAVGIGQDLFFSSFTRGGKMLAEWNIIIIVLFLWMTCVLGAIPLWPSVNVLSSLLLTVSSGMVVLYRHTLCGQSFQHWVTAPLPLLWLPGFSRILWFSITPRCLMHLAVVLRVACLAVALCLGFCFMLGLIAISTGLWFFL